jgi:23S rRNA pseudouridine1911/1915/1917 synthase
MCTLSIQPNDRLTFKVWHEDAHLAVVGKPAHVVTMPGKGHEHDTLLNALFARWGTTLQNLGKERSFGVLHRLDKETSGLVLVALRIDAYEALRAAFEERTVAKFYWAVVRGAPNAEQGVIRKPVAEYEGRAGDDPRMKKLARLSARGRPSVTAYRVVERGTAGSLLECRAVTGRLHQVRVHLESIGCPILGDDLYAPKGVRTASARLALHAHTLAFDHPANGERVCVRTPFPDDLRPLLRRMGLATPRVRTGASPQSIESADQVQDDSVRDEES